jgi:hypothetical protein
VQCAPVVILLSESLIQRPDIFISTNDEKLVNPLTKSDDKAATNVAPPQLERTTYPEVKFWFKRDWSLKRVCNEPPKVFVETEHGEAVGEDQLDDIRKYAHKFFDTIDKDKAPATWKQAPPDMKQTFHKLMVERFPELRLCEGGWKVDQMASNTYTSWHSYWVKRFANPAQTKPWKRRRTTSSVSRVSESLFRCYLFHLLDF